MYEIKVMSSDEFDSLPYKGINDSLGIADVKSNRVFVRDTGVHELNRYLINHEIDHMVEEHATDEDEHGIRHKKFFKEFIAPSLTGGLVSGGEVGGVYNAGAQGENKFQPVGFLGNAGGTTSSLMNNESIFGGQSPDGRIRQQEAQASQAKAQEDSFLNNFSSIFSNFNTGQGQTATAQVPNSVGGNVGGGINQPSITNASTNSELPPEVLARLRAGNYAGRYNF